MTNGTVAQKSNKVENNKVNSVEGNDMTVKFNGGTKIVTVTSDTKVVTLVPGDRSELKPNAKIFIPAATRTPDGALEARAGAGERAKRDRYGQNHPTSRADAARINNSIEIH